MEITNKQLFKIAQISYTVTDGELALILKPYQTLAAKAKSDFQGIIKKYGKSDNDGNISLPESDEHITELMNSKVDVPAVSPAQIKRFNLSDEVLTALSPVMSGTKEQSV